MSKVVVIYQQLGWEFGTFQLESTLNPCTGRNQARDPNLAGRENYEEKLLRNLSNFIISISSVFTIFKSEESEVLSR